MGVSRQVCRRAHGLRLCRFSPRFCQARRLDWGAALFVRLLSACLVLSELPELSSVLFRLFAEHSDDCLRRGMGEARPCPWICRDKCGEASFRAGRKGGDWEGRRIADVLLWLALCWLLPRFWGSASGAQRAVASAEGGLPFAAVGGDGAEGRDDFGVFDAVEGFGQQRIAAVGHCAFMALRQ